MKRIIFGLMSLFILCSGIFNFFESNFDENQRVMVKLDSLDTIDDFTFLAEETPNYTSRVGNIVINANYQSFSKKKLDKLIQDQDNIYIFYDLNLLDNATSSLDVLNNNATIYYYENGKRAISTYNASNANLNILKHNLSLFVNDQLDKINTPSVALLNNTNGFSVLHRGSFREDGVPYGYIDCDYVIKKNRASDITSLYIVEADMSFVPGAVAKDLDGVGYGDYYNSNEYVKLVAQEAEDYMDYDLIRYGGTPIFQDAFPVNTPGSVTITSYYEQNLSLGVSFSNGYSLDGVESENGVSMGLNIVEGYTKSYTNTEPALSAQKDPNNSDKYTWLFNYETQRKLTNNVRIGYIFEMNNDGHDLFEGDVALTFEYKMVVRKDFPFSTKHEFSNYKWNNHC